MNRTETTERKAYIKPEAQLIALHLNENIASSEMSPIPDLSFKGEEDVF